MPRHPEIADVLRGAGLTVVEHDGWRTRGSDAFTPAGVMIHHTASRQGSDAPSVGICIKGRPDLPGPLCQVVLARSGVCHMIAAGKANHAGAGSWGGYGGNTYWFAIEAENDGVGEPWPDTQLQAFIAAARALAAISSRGLVCGHKEYATPKGRKIDPTGIDMDWFRAQVAGAPAPPVPAPQPQPQPTPTPGGDYDMDTLDFRGVTSSRLTWLKGRHVDNAQGLLKGLATVVPTCDPGTIDGVGGPATRRAVKAAQSFLAYIGSYDGKADEVLGPRSWKALIEA